MHNTANGALIDSLSERFELLLTVDLDDAVRSDMANAILGTLAPGSVVGPSALEGFDADLFQLMSLAAHTAGSFDRVAELLALSTGGRESFAALQADDVADLADIASNLRGQLQILESLIRLRARLSEVPVNG